MVRRRPQFATGVHRPGQQVEPIRRDEPPPVVPFFRPRVGKQDENPAQRPGGQPGKQRACIIGEDPDVVERPVGRGTVDRRQQTGDAIEIWLATDEADVRMRCRLRRQVFAAAEADFQPNRTHRAIEAGSGIGRQGRGVERERRQQTIDEGLSAGPKASAAAAAVKNLSGFRGPGSEFVAHSGH